MKYEYYLLLNITIFIIITILFYYKKYFYKKKNNKLIKAYVINLDYRKDRKKRFIESYNLEDINYEIVNAIDKKFLIPNILFTNNILGKIGYNNLGLNIRNNHYEFNTMGAVACYLSHIKVWLKSLNDNVKYAIVFEDDVLFNNKITSNIIKEYIKKLPNDWHILLLNRNRIRMNKINNISDLYKVHRFLCTHSYVINTKIINYLLENILPINQQIDFKLSCLATNNLLNIYLFNNGNFYKQYENNITNIQTRSIKNASWDLNCSI
mgnify:CR=1 FL=1